MAVTKRYTVPKFWSVKLKENKYVVSPVPGPHSKMQCIPIGIVLRELLHHARTMKEAKDILGRGAVRVNGLVRKEHGFPVGLMDVINLDGDFYRVLPGARGLYLLKIDAGDADVRLARIRNKVHTKKKRLQLNLHDGSNILAAKDDYRTSDVVAISIEQKTIKNVIRFEKGSLAIVTGGHNSGIRGTIEAIDKKLKTVVLASGEKKLLVPIRYVFVVGTDKPAVNIGEGQKEAGGA